MADDNPAINSGLSLSYISLQAKLITYRDYCQDRLASFAMLPLDFNRYTELRLSLLSGDLSYAEFRPQMFGLLLQNPNYIHLSIYWTDYEQFIIRGIPLIDCPLFTFPIILYSQTGFPISLENITELEDLVTELWNHIPEQSSMRIPVPQLVLDRQIVYQQEVDRLTEWWWRQLIATQQEMARQQEVVRQQEVAREQQMAWQQEMARREEMASEEIILAHVRALDEQRRKKNREARQRRAENKKERERLQRERERLQREGDRSPQSSADSSTDNDDDGA